MFSFIWLVIIWSEGRNHLKLDVQGQVGERISYVDGQEGMWGLENWTIFMDVAGVSSLYKDVWQSLKYFSSTNTA